MGVAGDNDKRPDGTGSTVIGLDGTTADRSISAERKSQKTKKASGAIFIPVTAENTGEREMCNPNMVRTSKYLDFKFWQNTIVL